MEDYKIVDLYWERKEKAIAETEKKYGRLFRRIAGNILGSAQDAEECVNDAYVRAWESIPPQKPEKLSAFLGKITRNLALNRYAREHAQKREGGMPLILDEVAELIADRSLPAPDDALAFRELINRFLADLPPRTRIVFVKRYWYMYSTKEIAASCAISEGSVKMLLMRTRNQLKKRLEQEEML